MLIHSASQLVTISGGPQRGQRFGDLAIINNGAVLIEGEEISAIGPSDDMRAIYEDHDQVDARNRVVMPGFVDPHTHLVWAGDRANEFEMRLQGKSYMEIMDAGGGINSTVLRTRLASEEHLLNSARSRMKTMFVHGTTTAEAKTGYGLNSETELKMLNVIMTLNSEGPIDLIPTYLGAHAVAPEFKDDPESYTEFVCSKMLPELKDWWDSKSYMLTVDHPPFVDVFCERGAFNLQQSQRILERALELGFPIKIHADEFENLGGASLAVELGASSADHLVVTSDADIRELGSSKTVAVALPCTPFGLADDQYAPAKKILEAGGILAIATDLNPGTAWCESMQLVIALACRYMALTPAQAIVAATINAAAAIGVSDHVGTLDPGKQADLLILNVNDYRQLGYRFGTNLVDTIIKKGKIYPLKG